MTAVKKYHSFVQKFNLASFMETKRFFLNRFLGWKQVLESHGKALRVWEALGVQANKNFRLEIRIRIRIE